MLLDPGGPHSIYSPQRLLVCWRWWQSQLECNQAGACVCVCLRATALAQVCVRLGLSSRLLGCLAPIGVERGLETETWIRTAIGIGIFSKVVVRAAIVSCVRPRRQIASITRKQQQQQQQQQLQPLLQIEPPRSSHRPAAVAAMPTGWPITIGPRWRKLEWRVRTRLLVELTRRALSQSNAAERAPPAAHRRMATRDWRNAEATNYDDSGQI